MPMLNERELKELIAFSWSSVSGSGELTDNSWGDYLDCRQRFLGKSWQALSRNDIMTGRHCIRFLRIDALLYFVPAFLIYSLDELNQPPDADILDATLSAIELLTENRSRLSGTQMLTIQQYLGYLLKDSRFSQNPRVQELFRMIQVIGENS